MELAHACDDGLAGFFIGSDPECGVFFGERAQCLAELVLVGFGAGLHRHMDDRLGEHKLFQGHLLADCAQSVTSADILHADAGDDVARIALLAIHPVVGVHFQQPADAFFAPGTSVENGVAFSELAAVDPQIYELAHMRIGHNLESQSRKGGFVAHFQLNLFFRRQIHRRGGRHIQRRWQIIHHGI